MQQFDVFDEPTKLENSVLMYAGMITKNENCKWANMIKIVDNVNQISDYYFSQLIEWKSTRGGSIEISLTSSVP